MRFTRTAAALALLVASFAARRATADELPAIGADDRILGASTSALRVQSVTTRLSAFDQFGHGYQSQAGPTLGAGSERATVFEPQAEIVATQGARLTHRIWIPVDVVTAASPNSINKSVDVMSGASRHVVGGTFDWTASYKLDPATAVAIRNGLHLEEPFRSWHNGLTVTHSFADDSSVLSANLVGLFDWFDRFDITGRRHGHAVRTGTSATIGLTQIVTPTTVVNVNYGITVLAGTMGNTWNSVPLANLDRGPEVLPDERVRHAVVGRLSQFLPWNGAVRGYYRFYADDWGIVAHSMQIDLMQRVSPFLYAGVLYRFHTQTGARFFTTLAPLDAALRVADSDLAPLDSHTFGGKIVADFPLEPKGEEARETPGVRALHFEVGCERYTRTNDLGINIVTWATGFRF
jgi:hypothetical protein